MSDLDHTPDDDLFTFDFEGLEVRCGLKEEENDFVDGLGGFADSIGVLTKDEIGRIITNPNRKAGRKLFDSSWIKNQRRRNSCCPFAGAAVLEKARFVRGGSRVELGPEWTYANINRGVDRGALLNECIRSLETLGCPRRELVPVESYLKSQQKPEAAADAKRFRILTGEYFGIRTEEELASALAMGFPCLIACQVDKAGKWFKMDGNGVIYPTDGIGNHAIHCDDVRISSNGEYEFDHAGSWGTKPHQEGRAWITWKRHLKTTVRYHQFVAVRSTIDDPHEAQLPRRMG